MPTKIIKKSPKCYSLVNTITNRVYSKCTTKDKVQSQKRIIDNYETSWKGLINQNIKGQTFKSQKQYQDAIKKLSKKYKGL